jgi:hypothetical protein
MDGRKEEEEEEEDNYYCCKGPPQGMRGKYGRRCPDSGHGRRSSSSSSPSPPLLNIPFFNSKFLYFYLFSVLFIPSYLSLVSFC